MADEKARPPRPASEHPSDTGFTRQEMTEWLSPGQLVATGLKVFLSGIFGAYADKRESQEVHPAGYHDCSAKSELWFDFVSDLGDGFNPTYALATLLAKEKLDLVGEDGRAHATERGSVLVMGGDEVYPTADIAGYKNKMLGPYRAALPYTAKDSPMLFALPGNHDWYDGLTAFTRVFCQRGWIGGWKTSQRRSYFAAALPQRWWLWGIDIQFDTYIDEPQLHYFRDVVGPKLKAGDSVILCSAMPNWVKANEGSPHAYDTLDYFQRETIDRYKAVVRVNLTGDSHHYARYEAPAGGAQMITAGGGGAFLSATHHLPEDLVVPPKDSPDAAMRAEPAVSLHLEKTYPTRAESKKIARGIVTLPVKNPSFVGLMAAVYLLYAWTIQSALVVPGKRLSDVMQHLSFTGMAAGILHSPVAVVITAVLVLGLSGFTKIKTEPPKRYLLGTAHALAHLVAVVLLVGGVNQVLSGLRGLPYLAGYLVLVGAAGGLLGSLVMAGYLYVAGWFRCNDNELFAAQRIEDWKNFLRLHIDAAGVLTVYPVKVQRVPRKWQLSRGANIDDPWFEPVGSPPQPVLIENPIPVQPASGTTRN